MKSKPENPKQWRTKPKQPIIMTDEVNIKVLYEDNHIIAVNKRSSDIIQSDKSGDATLSDVIKTYLKRNYLQGK